MSVTGPRQSGKTTLCRELFPSLDYVSFEALDNRAFATEDPRGFLSQYGAGAILDEVQHVPELLGYLQVEVDERPRPGRFVITGSQHFGLSAAIAQSLAGRTAVHELLPPSLDELRRFDTSPADLLTTLWSGAYPALYDRGIPPSRWYADYVATYVQRDVRQLLAVSDLSAFTKFVKLCAGLSGQELNLTKLGDAAGITQQTAKSWMSVLEASYLVMLLPAWHANLKKRMVKTPKIHFLDSGLLCHLLGVRGAEELRHHPHRGAVFESWVVSEVLKARVHAGCPPDVFHYRETRGREVDLVVAPGNITALLDAKSGQTVVSDWFSPLESLVSDLAAGGMPADAIRRLVVYGGEREETRGAARAIPWSEIHAQDWVGRTS